MISQKTIDEINFYYGKQWMTEHENNYDQLGE